MNDFDRKKKNHFKINILLLLFSKYLETPIEKTPPGNEEDVRKRFSWKSNIRTKKGKKALTQF